jgi:MerR family transcriptional regulator/heat shock protein HspR
MTVEKLTVVQGIGSRGYYRLELVAERVGLSATRIRAYERIGLVQPSRVQGAIRYYDEAAIARLRLLRRLAEDLGLNAAGVEVVARLLEEIDRLRAEVKELKSYQT